VKVLTFSDNLAEQNTYVLVHLDRAIIIDPGFNGSKVRDYLNQHRLQIEKILLTHGHFDHIRDLESFSDIPGLAVWIHPEDRIMLYQDEMNYAKAFRARFVLPPNLEIQSSDTEEMVFCNLMLRVIHTPGHTAGSSSFLIQRCLFSGDTLFLDSVGRTDLASGSRKAMHHTIKKLDQMVSNETLIYPGHGMSGRYGSMKTTNPYIYQL
jgi:glyoxylase-like metal-dependent hydrolase (beta-lactamase superfamily II)